MYQIIAFLVLLIIGYFFGKFFERKHFSSIISREKKYCDKITLVGKQIDVKSGDVLECGLAIGSVVISIDYFKKFIALLINFIGGNVKSYESLLDRARREALLRMKESAPEADMFINTRIETSSISGRNSQKNGVGSIEIMAYSTALKLRK